MFVQKLASEEVIALVQGNRQVGSLRRFVGTQAPSRSVLVVQNLHGQDLGIVDELGRAWRYRPHQEPKFLGTWSVEEGALRILGVYESPQ